MSLRFQDQFLKKLEYLQVVSRREFAGRNRADRRTPKKGRGIEFADHRQYARGDDFRHIDWKAYKRVNRLLLRLFEEEQDLPIYLILDVSGSMAEAAKFDLARQIAAALCYVGLVHLDHLTILTFSRGLAHESSPGRGTGRIFRVFDLLEKLEAAGPTDLRESLKEFASRSRPVGLTVIISDFLDPGGFEAGLKILRSIGHDVFAIHVASPADRDPGAIGDVRFVDAETGEVRDADVTPRLVAAYARAWDTHATELQSFCGRYGMGYVRADTDRPFEEIVLQAFRQGRFLE
jgi:uncharacterized protein (DUF58 family)